MSEDIGERSSSSSSTVSPNLNINNLFSTNITYDLNIEQSANYPNTNNSDGNTNTNNEESLKEINNDSADNTPYNRFIFSFKEGVNIATHNIRSLSRSTKLQEWIEFCAEANLYIIALSETKLTENRTIGYPTLYTIYTRQIS